MTRNICLLFALTLALGACTERTDRFANRAQKMEGDAAPPTCGDGKCDKVLEDCSKCPKDCGGPCTGCQAKVTPGCKGCMCEKVVCAKDPSCCSKVWDKVCVTHCKSAPGGCGVVPEAGMPDFSIPTADKSIYDLSPPQGDGTPDQGKPKCGNGNCELPSASYVGDFCDTCPGDCGKCTGCQEKPSPGCKNCKCTTYVCKQDSYCCTNFWDRKCVNLCKASPTGCGIIGTDMGKVDQAKPDALSGFCGDGKCFSGKEFCDTCPKDCGQCDGCKVKKNAGCKNCKCEKAVCKANPNCCSSGWGNTCVSACKVIGCGLLGDLGVDMALPDKALPDKGPDRGADLSEDAILAQYDMNYQGDGYNKNLTDWRSNPKYWEAGSNNYSSSSKYGTSCNCEVTSPRPPPFLILLALIGLVFHARRRR